MNFRTIVQLIMGFTGFGIWTFAAYYDPAMRGDYMHFVTGVVVGMAALALRDMPAPAAKIDVPKEITVKQSEDQQ